MRILLDECVDESLRRYFEDHRCQTCRFAGFKGLTNGELIAAAEKAGFEILITVDQNLVYQQNFINRDISVILLRARTTNMEDLIVLIPDVIAALKDLKRGEVVHIGNR